MSRDQEGSDLWRAERRKRIMASAVGGICKMQKKTKRSNKVKALLYSRFKGNLATQYGSRMESVAREKYVSYQRQVGCSNLTTVQTGLVISQKENWLAASPDDRVVDNDSVGLVENKNPYAARNLTIAEACDQIPNFCLEKYEKDGSTTYRLKKRHDYYYQIQCQLFCDNKDWCDFVVNTEKDIHIERIYHNIEWWKGQMPKLKDFYFETLLPELACPRYGQGSIREPDTYT